MPINARISNVQTQYDESTCISMFKCIATFTDTDESVLIEIPDYLEVFSSTNELEAAIEGRVRTAYYRLATDKARKEKVATNKTSVDAKSLEKKPLSIKTVDELQAELAAESAKADKAEKLDDPVVE